MVGHIPGPIDGRQDICALPPAIQSLDRPPSSLAAEGPIPEGAGRVRGESGSGEIG